MKNSNRAIRDSLIRAVGSMGLHIAERTPPERLQHLVRSLRPVDGGVELIRLGPDGDGGYLGPDGDGGYLVPDDLAGIEYAFSPGVSTESGFEAALAGRGLRVFLADFSVDGPAQVNANFAFQKKYVGCMSDDTFMRLEEWKSSVIGADDGDVLLQMDIEGGEYETLLAAPAALLSQFRIMVIEFHHLHELFNQRFFDLAARAFEKLLQTHTVVHIHPNNCCGSVRANGLEVPRIAEFTFHRNDRILQHAYRQTFPHPLDRNNTRKATLALPACWYQ